MFVNFVDNAFIPVFLHIGHGLSPAVLTDFSVLQAVMFWSLSNDFYMLH